jgi:hypothetical protein
MEDLNMTTPPPDKIHNWLQLEKIGYSIEQIIALAAQWGADQELEACCEWLASRDLRAQSVAPCLLRAARRPKLLSLKKQALTQLDEILKNPQSPLRSDTDIIRRALEQLPDN